MFSNKLATFAAVAATLAALQGVVAAPVSSFNSLRVRDDAKASAGGHFVVYQDSWVSGEQGPPDVKDIAGFDAFIMSFWLSSAPADQAVVWAQLTDDQRKTVKDQYNAAGIKLMVSAFGATEQPTTSKADAAKTAESLADWVIKMNLDGVDVDYEDMTAMNAQDGSAEKWLVDFTKALRAKLPSPKYIITHAPVAPWFSPDKYKTGAYLTVDKEVGSMIDWYNLQFYNQGASEYTDCAGLFDKSSSAWPKTSVFEIHASGVDLNKLVVGKPATTADATNGFMDAKTLSGCMADAQSKGWNAGAMSWQYPNAKAEWAQTVRGTAFPVGAGGNSSAAPSSAMSSASAMPSSSEDPTATPTDSSSPADPTDSSSEDPTATPTDSGSLAGPTNSPSEDPTATPTDSSTPADPTDSTSEDPTATPTNGSGDDSSAPSMPTATGGSDDSSSSAPVAMPSDAPISSAPVGSAPIAVPSVTGSAPSSAPSGTSGAGCSSAAWSQTTAYTGGQTVTYKGHAYTAAWWTQAETPSATSSVWKDTGAC